MLLPGGCACPDDALEQSVRIDVPHVNLNMPANIGKCSTGSDGVAFILSV